MKVQDLLNPHRVFYCFAKCKKDDHAGIGIFSNLCKVMASLGNLYFSLLLSFIIGVAHQGMAQSSDLQTLQKMTVAKSQLTAGTAVRESYKPAFFPIRILYTFYRGVVSEQISANCAFDLSCSRFSAKAFGTFGFVKAGLLTADRLTRCNPQVAHEIPPTLFNTKTGKIIDEPAQY